MEKDLERLKNKTLKLLSYRPRSISEIKFCLKRLEYATPALINQTIEYFIDSGLLDDQKFAEWWVDQRTTHRPKGNIALKSELLQKGIDDSIINSVLLDFDQEQELAKKLLEKKKITDKQKAYKYLYSRGFSNLQGFSL
ncbi:MAG: regulatory protein RecX [Candidatus Beckwithbacteria bacterium]|nr:recombination regulator RecX [Patescibacteria group bacterium]